jgi:hypothetical protein
MSIEHIADLAEPFTVVRIQDIVMPELEHDAYKQDEHRDPDERVQNACPRATAKQAGQKVHGRMKEREARQPSQNEQ